MSQLLTGKTAIITGGSRGIGYAILKKFVENGANVAFTYLSSEEKARAIEQEFSDGQIKVKGYKVDAADFTATEQFVNDVMQTFGQIDIVVNNAGISIDNLLLRLTPEQWDKVLRANLDSVYNLTKQVIKPMIKAKSGTIINMSSVVGVSGNPGQAAYAASKAGIIGFSKSIALELASRNIRCNAIAPGFVETDMTSYLKDGEEANNKWFEKIPMARYAKPEEIANVSLFLASDLSSYVTGQVINVCGGLNT
jgi:3-oxoacyl-[acyl-carrier protein] reductase